MREISLHILDIMENSVRAGATEIRVAVALDADRTWLTLSVEDNGPGLPVTAEQALDPFFTTKAGKRTGLGLSLFRAAAEQAGGRMRLDTAESGGIRVEVEMQYGHLDRAPLGDMGDTMMAILLSNPDIRLVCSCSSPDDETTLDSHRMIAENPDASLFAVARQFGRAAQNALDRAGIRG